MAPALKYKKTDPDLIERLSQKLCCHPVLAKLLADRGILDSNEADFFLNPTFENLTDPFLLKDMSKSVRRIYTAVLNKEKILIFGDFDADGITSTALLVDFLAQCDAEITWYIPHRIKEGYSLQVSHIDFALDQDIDLIITVDCGISSHDAVEKARLEDIDVIITDHHEVPEDLPDAFSIINPKQADCLSGLDYLAGVGVAFFLVVAMRTYFREKNFWEEISEPNLLNSLDLFTIGTIGDMVPLIKDNRTLCIAGLKIIRKGDRQGLKSLAQVSRIDIQKLDSDDISFKIVPRINAAGRISHARICVSQLIDTDIVATEKTAIILDQLNTKRQKIEQDIVCQIENKIREHPELLDQKILFLWHQSWDPGVLGIAASRLSKKYYMPVILLSSANEHAIGSGRSINNINIHKALAASQSLLVKFGGHAMASGLTVKKDNLEELGDVLKQHMATTYPEADFKKSLNIDAELGFDQIDYALAKEIDRLRPFGVSNPEPVFLSRNVRVAASFIVGANHRKMILENGSEPYGHTVEAVQFNLEDPDKPPDFFPRIIFKLKLNTFKSHSARIILEDV